MCIPLDIEEVLDTLANSLNGMNNLNEFLSMIKLIRSKMLHNAKDRL